ncbi:MAG TPA: nucleotidyltransferase family protein [Candidatus Eisenbacteria bacterium]|nr:nucleotidyltransferase family protein [Candidatus Eisenbacteria bacterium]
MRAMILAAGLGTRLRPLTDDRPKALVEVNGKTLLEITLRRLATFGIHDVIVNVHHFADLVIEFLQRNQSFGMRVEVSREDLLLDTGGGLKKAAWFFLENGDKEKPFLLHNVDVISTIDFSQMLQSHEESGALATIAVKDRPSSRYLLFDEKNQLCGRRTAGIANDERIRPSEETHAYAFCGIHVVSPRLLPMLDEKEAFSIIASYLRLAGQGQVISAFRADGYYWRDLGTPARVKAVAEDLATQAGSL